MYDIGFAVLQGKNLIETSTQGLGRADAYLYQNGKKEQVTLFLFDHVLIICKKVREKSIVELMIDKCLYFKDRRNSLVYLARADLDHSEFEDLIDGKGKIFVFFVVESINVCIGFSFV